MRRTTLAELGNHMAIGLETPAGPRPTQFAFRPWGTQDDLAIGKERADNPAMNPAELLDRILARMLTQWGTHDFTSCGEGEKMLILSRSWSADLFTAWAQLRRATCGASMPEQIRCRGCRKTYGYDIDLDTLEVDVLDEDDFVHHEVDLFDGLVVPGKSGTKNRHTTVTIAPIRWEVYRTLQMKDLASAKQKLVGASVVGAGLGDDDRPLESFWLAPELQGVELSKKDLEMLSDDINETSFGPKLRIEPTCPTCGAVTVEAISWVYDGFFSVRASSRSHRRKRSDARSSISSSTAREDSSGT